MEKEMNQRLSIIEAFKSSHQYALMNEKQREKQIKNYLCSTQTTTEDKRTKNDEYYRHNSEALKKDRNQKVECPVCGLSISKQNVIKHPNTTICKLTSENNKLKEEVEELKKYNQILVNKLNRKTRKPLK